MPLYFLQLDAALFHQGLRPALAASWRERSFLPCRRLCDELRPRIEAFAERYEGPTGPADAGSRPYRPRGIEMRYLVVRDADGTFTFTAPWGEPMVARPGDAIVRNPDDPADTYRIAAAAFACTYEILEPAS